MWAKGRCKVKHTTLQRPKTEAGLALPDMYMYYLAGQLRHLRNWLIQEQSLGVEKHLLNIIQAENLLIGLEVRGTQLPRVKIPMLSLIQSVWREAKKLTRFKDIPSKLPMWNNPLFEELSTLQDNKFWMQKGIVELEQVDQSGSICSFDFLKTQ